MFRERHPVRWLFVWILLTLPPVYYVTIPLIRYRGLVDPFIILLIAYAFVPWLYARLESREPEGEISASPMPAV